MVASWSRGPRLSWPLHLVSGAGWSFSTWNHSSSSETVAQWGTLSGNLADGRPSPLPLPARRADPSAGRLGSSTGCDRALARVHRGARSELDAVGGFQVLDPVVLDGDPV